MNKTELRARVAQAVHSSWKQFQEEHPALAQVIDQETLSVVVVESLGRDADFMRAYTRAAEIGAGAEVFIELVDRFVGVILRRLR